LEKLDGVEKVEIDFDAEEAKVTYSSDKISVEKIIQTIEKTPHMMGAGQKYRAKVKSQ
jgi:copper chaperone CopZ